MARRKQGYDARLDDSLGMRHRGAHKQSLKDRRDESKAMEKARGKRAYSGDRSMDARSHSAHKRGDSHHHHHHHSQGYDARLDESLGMRHRGHHDQSLKARRDESKGMEKASGHRAYSGDKSMDRKLGHDVHHHSKHKAKNSTRDHGVHGRDPYWARGGMEYGQPRDSVIKQWPRYDQSCECDYARPGYNNDVAREAEDRLHAREQRLKGMYV